jgi:DNA-binding PucR family transcriptional regulator
LGENAPQVLVALLPGATGLPAGWQLPAATATVGADATVAVLVPLPGQADLRPAGALAAAALARLPVGSTAGVSQVRIGFADLGDQWSEACAAARVAAAVARLSPVAQWAELGAWRSMSELSGPDPVVRPLLADPVLAQTAETFLDCAGSASRASTALQIHRQTLYYRLSRIASITGLDLADGESRLLLHASLKAARLATGGRPRPAI